MIRGRKTAAACQHSLEISSQDRCCWLRSRLSFPEPPGWSSATPRPTLSGGWGCRGRWGTSYSIFLNFITGHCLICFFPYRCSIHPQKRVGEWWPTFACVLRLKFRSEGWGLWLLLSVVSGMSYFGIYLKALPYLPTSARNSQRRAEVEKEDGERHWHVLQEHQGD